MTKTMSEENNRVNIKDLTLAEMSEFFKTLGEPSYRARQTAEWIFKKGVTDFISMTNIPLALKNQLTKNAYIGKVKILNKQVSSRYGTVKYLMGLDDGQTVETVLMKHSYGHSVCISTQVGCSMGCAMCASALGGKVRNLSSGEMYGQIQAVQEDSGERVSHVVLMGTGEPLDNYKNTVDFLININADYGYNIGYRHITLSTCGLVP
ncbi:MAG: 23S rRNA (adenine(2503)-C(2))-methyltransferase RlmN, partial [Peptococcaceae bacterium]|nr:23S rRNA (adenine(2503)-C(2))-methyltransferase RlmN [Peptococcaceae bacterium]